MRSQKEDYEKEELLRKLEKLEARYRILEDNITDVIWRLDLRTMKLLYVSPSVKQLRGYTQAEVMQQTMEQCLTPASYAYVQQLISQKLDADTYQLKDRIEPVYILEQPCKDGSTVWTEVTLRLLHRENGSGEVVGISRNYNKQKKQQEDLWAANKKLEEGEVFFNEMMDAVPWIVCCVNREGQIIYANKQCRNIFHVDSKQEEPFYNCLFPCLRDKHLGLFKKCLQGCTVTFAEKEPLPVELRYVYGIYNPIQAAAGEIRCVMIVAMDITSQKETEIQLLEAQRIAKMGSYEWNLQAKQFQCSEGLLDLFQIDASRYENDSYRALLDKIHPDDRNTVKHVFKQLLSDQLPFQWEFRLIEESGDSRIIQSTHRLDYDNQGRPYKIVGSLIDVTERRQTEKLQREAAERLRDFARTLPDIAFIATEDGQIIEKFGNRELRHKDSFMNDLKRIMLKKDVQELLEKIHYALLHDTVQFGEYMMDTALGRRMFEMRIAPMRYIANGKRTVACNAIDVTDKNRAQRFLELSYEQRRQREILNDLVEGRLAPSQLVLDQAWRVKLNLACQFSCYLVIIKAWKGKPLDHWLDYREGYQFFVDSLTEVLASEMKAIVWESREGIAILCPLLSGCKDIKAHELSMAGRMKEIVYSYFPDASIIIGIGEFHADTFQNIALIYSQACEAAQSGQTISSEQDIFHYLDLGIFQILPLLSDRDKVLAFIDRTLGKLVEYDRKKGSNLLLTMEKILQADNLKEVAKEMFVHYKTISFRKKRIEKILGRSLDMLDDQTTLNTALKLRQLFTNHVK